MFQKKSLGQVFLTDPNIQRKIIDAANIQSHETVVEIGCGNGALTGKLKDKAGQLFVIDLDNDCLQATQSAVPDPSQITWICEDILTHQFQDIPEPFVVVSNLPYYISAKFIQLLGKRRQSVTRAVVMFQTEFSQKIIATPGTKEYTSLSVYSQFYGQAKKLFNVSRQCFFPVPNVDSTVIEWIPNHELPPIDCDHFNTMVQSIFWGRRKTLHRVLHQNPYIQVTDQLKGILESRGWQSIRAESFDVPQFLELYDAIKDHFSLRV